MSATGRIRSAAIGVIALALIAIPVSFRLERANADLEHVGYGVSAWRRLPDGRRYRRSDGEATVFVPAAAAALSFSASPEGNGPVRLRLELDGRLADEVTLAPGQWRPFRVAMPAAGRNAFVPLRLTARDQSDRPAPFLFERIESISRQ